MPRPSTSASRSRPHASSSSILVITKAVAAHNEAAYMTLETLGVLPLKCTPVRIDGRRLLHMVGEYFRGGVFAVKAGGAVE